MRSTPLWAKRGKDLIAIWLIGDGVLTVIAPRQRALLCAWDPRGYVSPFSGKPSSLLHVLRRHSVDRDRHMGGPKAVPGNSSALVPTLILSRRLPLSAFGSSR